jgi:hypothetical protein
VARVLSELNRPDVYAVTSVFATADGEITLEVETGRRGRIRVLERKLHQQQQQQQQQPYVVVVANNTDDDDDTFTWYHSRGVHASVAEKVASDALAAVRMMQRQ